MSKSGLSWRVFSMISIKSFDLVGPQGTPFQGAGALRMLSRIKGDPQDARHVFKVSDGSQIMVMKMQRTTPWRRWLRPRARRVSLLNEMRMLRDAAEARLPVPSVLAQGSHRRMGMCFGWAILMPWLDGYCRMQDWVRSAALRGDVATVRTGRWIVVDLLGRIRKAGFADRDFGLHNVMVRVDAHNSSQAFDAHWLDLEFAHRAAASDEQVNADTIGGMLANWWVNTRGDEQEHLAMARELTKKLMTRVCSTRLGVERVNVAMSRRIERAVRRSKFDRPPPPLAVSMILDQ